MRNASTVATAVAPVEVAKMTSVRWKIFFAMLLLISINYIDRASLSVAMPLIGKEFNMDPAVQGLVLSSFFWTYAFMQIPGGMLADRFKPRIVIAAATIGWGFFQADRRREHGLGDAAPHPPRSRRRRGADLSRRRQAQRDVDDPQRARARGHPARRRRAARRRAGRRSSSPG